MASANGSAGWPRAVLFDFDGVIVNSEPFHCAATCAVMDEWGMPTSQETYYRELIGFDDKGGFGHLFKLNGRPYDDDIARQVIAAKNRRVLAMIERGPVAALPGATAFIRSLASTRLLAICSGALRNEIEAMLKAIGLRDAFETIVAGGEVAVGKPDPMGYLETVAKLSARHGGRLSPEDCLVVEDAPKVAARVRERGFKVLGVTTSHPAEKWPPVDWLAHSLQRTALQDAGLSL